MHKENNASATIGNYQLFSNNPLGKGATGTVYKGQERSSKQSVAIKHIDLATIRDDATKTLLQNEIKALKMLSHSNILQLKDIVETSGNLYIVTELLQGGTLHEYLSKKGPLSQNEAMNLFKGILAGCTAIIDGGVIHRDLKPTNIMLTGNTPKIIDFGFCEVILGGGIVRAFNVGSPAYMAPEALLRTLYSEKSDSWSLGVILYEMLHGKTPDYGVDVKEFLQKVKNNPSLIKDSIKPGLSNNTRQLLQKSLTYKTEDRLSVSGMKYLTDVFMINANKMSSGSSANINSSQTPKANAHLTPINLAHPNLPQQRNEFSKNHETDRFKSKITSSIMYTELPHRQMKQNHEKVPHTHGQYFSQPNHQNYQNQPNHPFIRTQPYSQNRMSQMDQQPPNGFISYSQFMKPIPLNDPNRRSKMMPNFSKATSITQDDSEPSLSLKDVFNQRDERRQSVSSKQIMERPPGKPMFRHVTVRYI